MISEKRRGPATLQDVAHHAGVNKYTVSAVLNGFKSNTRVSEKTRQRILQAVEELHYQPNAIARSLRRRRTDIIGVYNGTTPVYGNDPFFGMILEGLQRGSLTHEVDLLMHGRHPSNEFDSRAQMLADGKVDGFVLVAYSDDPFVEWLVKRGIPAVSMADPIPTLPSIAVDGVQGAHWQAEHLAERGHKRVIYRTMPAPLPAMLERQHAFFERAHQLEMEVELIHSSIPCGYILPEEEPVYQRIKSAKKPFSAVVCCNDIYAYRTLNYLLSVGIKIPQDVALMGFDGLDLLTPYTYKLTTVAAPWKDVAITALNTLVAQINGTESLQPRRTNLPIHFVEGNTT